MYEENTRVFGTPYESNPALTQFKRTMEREGKVVTTYTGGTEFKAFFRIREDNENEREVITMFYDVTAPVRPGTLVMYGYGVFIALNRETVENEIYYKSALVKCNGVYNDNYGNVTNVPFYTDNMKSSVSIGNQTISMLNGNIELITEENSISKKIAINDYFNEFGRTFKVTNRYTMDGITHLIAEVEADRQPAYNYSIVIDGVPQNEVKVNDTAKLTATPYINGSVTTGATFEWSSSDTAIASIDGVGNAVFLKEGTVKFTAKWVEKDVLESTSVITVGNGSVTPPTEDYTATIEGRDELKLGLPRIYAAIFTDSSGNEVTDVEFTWNVVSDFMVEQVIDGNTIELYVEDEDAIGSTFLLQIITNETVMTELEIMIIDMF